MKWKVSRLINHQSPQIHLTFDTFKPHFDAGERGFAWVFKFLMAVDNAAR